MPDSKITALTSISTSTDPANDPLVIVDVSDTSMAATGTTKKVTLNQLLGASGTATLASATITGALTIGGATSFPVSVINTSGGNPIFTPTASTLFLYSGSSFLSIRNQANTQEIFNLTPAGVYTFGDGAGGTRMTLNATGLAIGDTAFAGTRLTLRESASQPNALAMTNRNATQTWRIGVDVSAVDDKILGFYDSTSTTFRMQLTDTGNLISTVPTTPPTLALNSTAVWNLTSNTNLRVSVRGIDGVTRTANITLA